MRSRLPPATTAPPRSSTYPSLSGRTCWLCTSAEPLLPFRLARGRGAICAVGSELGLCGDPSAPHYAAAKGAIHALVRSLAPEVARAGVRVNCVAPGPTDTPLLRDDPNLDQYASVLPLGRLLQPAEIAAAICFALLEDTTLTGQVVSPNAGAVL